MAGRPVSITVPYFSDDSDFSDDGEEDAVSFYSDYSSQSSSSSTSSSELDVPVQQIHVPEYDFDSESEDLTTATSAATAVTATATATVVDKQSPALAPVSIPSPIDKSPKLTASMNSPDYSDEPLYPDEIESSDDDLQEFVDAAYDHDLWKRTQSYASSEDPTLGAGSPSEIFLGVASNSTRLRTFPTPFRGSWTAQDDYVGLAFTPVAPSAQDDVITRKHRVFEMKSLPFKQPALALNFSANEFPCFEKLLARTVDSSIHFEILDNQDTSVLKALHTLQKLCKKSESDSTFASCFSLLYKFWDAWNEAQEEIEEVSKMLGREYLDPVSHRHDRIEAHLREWLTDELLKHKGNQHNKLGHQILQELAQGRVLDAQVLTKRKCAALGTVLASSLWDIQQVGDSDVLDAKDIFAQWITLLFDKPGLVKSLVKSCEQQVQKQNRLASTTNGGKETRPISNENLTCIFDLVLGRLHRTGGLYDQINDQLRNPTDKHTPHYILKELIQRDWKHALSMSLFYGRKDREANGTADSVVDMPLTRILQDYTNFVLNEGDEAPETVKQYRELLNSPKGAYPKAPLERWPALLDATKAKEYLGSRFQCRVWHVLNVLRSMMKLEGMMIKKEKCDGKNVEETVKYMFFHAYSALAPSIGSVEPQKSPHGLAALNNQLVWYLGVVLDKSFSTLRLKLDAVHIHKNGSRFSVDEILTFYMDKWDSLIVGIAAAHQQERASMAGPQPPDTDLLEQWAHGLFA